MVRGHSGGMPEVIWRWIERPQGACADYKTDYIQDGQHWTMSDITASGISEF